MKFRPSAMPILAKCPAFESAGSDFADLGSDRHAALQAHFAGDDSLLALLDEESQAGIKWAAEYIRVHAPMSDYPLEWERKRSFTAPNFATIEGTPDVTCGPVLFDFKWRPRNYAAQMACYSLMILEDRPNDVIKAHLLFGAVKRAEVIEFDLESATKLIGGIIDRCEQNPAPTACDYCSWCAKQYRCEAMTKPAATVAKGYSDIDEIKNWHPSEMTRPEDIATGLRVARLLKKWCESMEYHALEAATKRGLKLAGFELKERAGKKYVSDTARAYELSGLPPEKFLQACGVRLASSKTTGLIGLDKIYAETEGSQAAGKRAAEKKLADVITRGKSTLALVATGDKDAAE